MNTMKISAASIALAATTGLAAAGSLELDRTYASELKSDASSRELLNSNVGGGIQIDVGTRFYYGINNRDDGLAGPLGDDDTTLGFAFSEVEVRATGDVTENMRATISADFGPDDGVSGNSSINLEDALVDWTVNDGFTLRIGQFVPGFSSEASTSEFHTLNTMRSVSHEWLGTPSWVQGVEGHFGGDTWDASVSFNDGFGTWSTPFNSSAEADFAFTARVNVYSDSDKSRFDDQTAWRGQSAGWTIGGGLHYQTSGETNPASTSGVDAFFYTIDGAYEADGWGLRGAFYGASIDIDGGADYDNYGFEFLGSVFLSDQSELYLRYDGLSLDDMGVAITPSDEDFYSFISFGYTYYFIPESHAAKFNAEINFAFDDTSAITGTSGDTGVTPIGSGPGTSGFLGNSDDGEFQFVLGLQWLF